MQQQAYWQASNNHYSGGPASSAGVASPNGEVVMQQQAYWQAANNHYSGGPASSAGVASPNGLTRDGTMRFDFRKLNLVQMIQNCFQINYRPIVLYLLSDESAGGCLKIVSPGPVSLAWLSGPPGVPAETDSETRY
eukprot:g16413.t1